MFPIYHWETNGGVNMQNSTLSSWERVPCSQSNAFIAQREKWNPESQSDLSPALTGNLETQSGFVPRIAFDKDIVKQ